MASKLSREERLQLMDRFNINKKLGVNYIGWIFSDDMAAQIDRMKTVEMRDGDVITVGYPRCGNHWAFEVVGMAVKNTTEFKKEDFAYQLMEHRGDDVVNILAREESPRHLVTHFRPRMLPLQTLEKKVKIVYLLRNPKDAFVSMYKFWKKFGVEYDRFNFYGTFDDFLRLELDGDFPYGSYFDHIWGMEQFMFEHPHIPVHVHCYDEMKKDPEKTTAKLCEFLGAPADLAPRIAQITSISNMKDLDKFKAMNAEFSDNTDDNFLLRKGEAGGWRNELTTGQSKLIDEEFERLMAGSKLADIIRPYMK